MKNNNPKNRINQLIVAVSVMGLLLSATSEGATAITHKVIINPIQTKLGVSSTEDFHVGNPGRTLFEEETNKILAQAGVQVEWLDWQLSAGDGINNIVIGGLGAIKDAGDPGALFPITDAAGRLADPNKRVINMWFVSGLSGLGVASGGSGRIAIGNATFSAHSTSPNDSLGTVAHEIGHVLGLSHFTGANSTETESNLMAQGGVRNKPLTIGEIAPDGAGLDFLNAGQIATIQQDNQNWLIAVPEPSSLMLLGLGSLALFRRRRTES